MMHVFRIAVLSFLILSMGGAAFAEAKRGAEEELPSAMELYQNYIKANGGHSNLMAIASFKVSGEAILESGASIGLKVYRKRPNRMRVRMEYDTYRVDTIFNGEDGWHEVSSDSGESKIIEFSAEELEYFKQSSSIEGPFFKLGGREKWIVSIAAEAVRGEAAYRVEISPEAGIGYDAIWLSAENFQEIKLRSSAPVDDETDAMEVEEVYYTGFEQVGGVWFANEVEYFTNGQSTKRLELDRVRTNVGIYDSFFDKP